MRILRGLTPPARHRYAAIHCALLTGFLSSIAQRTEAGDYLAAGGLRCSLWPGSALADKRPKWVVSAELVETTRRYLRTNARIDPAWIEPLAGHLVQRTYTAPHWDPDSLGVLAEEKVSLFGLPIVPRRRIRYAKIDPVATRRLFLQHGLVEGNWPEPPEFLAHNLSLARQLADLQTRSRQPAHLREDEELRQFYEGRIPADILDGHRLRQWLRTADVQPLFMTEADLLRPAGAAGRSHAVSRADSAIAAWNWRFTYKHEPGSADDGVTVIVPQAGLNQLDADRLGWLIPGCSRRRSPPCCELCRRRFAANWCPCHTLPGRSRSICGSVRDR